MGFDRKMDSKVDSKPVWEASPPPFSFTVHFTVHPTTDSTYHTVRPLGRARSNRTPASQSWSIKRSWRQNEQPRDRRAQGHRTTRRSRRGIADNSIAALGASHPDPTVLLFSTFLTFQEFGVTRFCRGSMASRPMLESTKRSSRDCVVSQC